MKAIETALSLTQAYKLGIERFEKMLGNGEKVITESEIIARKPSASVLSSSKKSTTLNISKLISLKNFRIYFNNDIQTFKTIDGC